MVIMKIADMKAYKAARTIETYCKSKKCCDGCVFNTDSYSENLKGRINGCYIAHGGYPYSWEFEDNEEN